MDKGTFESQKPFAGEKKPSMKRRFVGHDYSRPGLYMLTMVVEGRRPLFARVYGTSDDPLIELSPLGAAVRDEWWGISKYYPQIEVLDLQMMPDHLHGILYVREQLPCDLSRVVRGFKTGCGRAYRRLVAPIAGSPYVATESQQTLKGAAVQQTKKGEHPEHGLLFEPGFNDRVLREYGQLQVWRKYLRDNPRRLLMKREHPDLFRVQRDLAFGPLRFSAIGNRFLLERPERVQVHSPCISPGEKLIMRAAFEERLPLIVLQENGFTDLAKPYGRRMEACASGQLLLLAPWEHHNERLAIRRDQCMALNEMARMICEGSL